MVKLYHIVLTSAMQSQKLCPCHSRVRFESVETFRRWHCHTQSATDSICRRPAPIGLVSLHFDFPFVRGGKSNRSHLCIPRRLRLNNNSVRGTGSRANGDPRPHRGGGVPPPLQRNRFATLYHSPFRPPVNTHNVGISATALFSASMFSW